MPAPDDLVASRTLFVVLGNQLFPFAHVKPYRACRFYMAEDQELCTYVRHHKQKIVLFLAAMRAYRDQLRARGCTVHYEQLDGRTGPDKRTRYETKLGRYAETHGITDLLMWEVEDKFFERRLRDFARDRGLALTFLPSPMFLTSRAEFAEYLDDAASPRMAEFYKRQRRRLDVLLDADGSPRGGKWSFDDENRKALPKDVEIPATTWPDPGDHVGRVIPFVNEAFSDHPGELREDAWWLPTTRRQALAWLRRFLEDRFRSFGDYEDALSTRDPVLFHSVLSPLLNLGLLTPREVLDRALEHAKRRRTPLNSLEGFVRQIIGWREFVRGIYQAHSKRQDHANFFGHRRSLSRRWYQGTTGLRPLDDVIGKALRLGWTHHIERLMVAGNLMVLCEIRPRAAHRWFMEMFVDSSDWVMGPNVYGMGIFSDGGLFSTKPYICGSNYILKMSDYTRPADDELVEGCAATWCDVMDGLYWRFIDRNQEYFKGNARLAVMVRSLEKLETGRRDRIVKAADRFIRRVTA